MSGMCLGYLSGIKNVAFFGNSLNVADIDMVQSCVHNVCHGDALVKHDSCACGFLLYAHMVVVHPQLTKLLPIIILQLDISLPSLHKWDF